MAMIGQRELSIEDYLAIASRRKWLLIIPALVFSAGAYVVSLFLPARYRSETVVLVEAPAVSPDIVKPIGGDTNQRLATMREEILSRTRLQKIIDKFGLYKEDIGRRPMEELVGRLRASIEVSAVKPMDRTNANGLPGFTIDVTASQAQLAQEICTEITSMFLQQNVILSERKAEDTTEFISKQLEDSKTKLDEQDAKLADFQRRNMGSLPDESQTNFTLLTGLSSQLDSVSQSIDRAHKDKLLLESELAQQIAASKLPQTAANPDTLARHVSELQEQLASLKTRYTDDYPDVVKIKNEIAELQERMLAEPGNSKQPNDADRAGLPVDTPQVQQLRTQLRQVDLTIQDRTNEQARLQGEIRRVQARLELTPAVAQEYKALTRDYQTALNIYNDFLKKQNDSEVSRDLLRRQQGEQFRVLDPPSLPQRPTFPSQPLFGLGGFAGGLGLGLAITTLLEMRDTTLRVERDVERLLKLPTLASIPLATPAKGSGRGGSRKTRVKQPEELVAHCIGAQKHV